MATILLKVVVIAVTTKLSLCTIDGLSYMDPMNLRPLPPKPGSDPCNPLYWYPQHRPDYCYSTTPGPLPAPPPPPPPPPPPIPVPVPVPVPIPVPLPGPLSPPPYIPPLPYGVPIISSHPMVPVAAGPPPPLSPIPRTHLGMVPGIPGLVSENGGINILPFSDAYSEMLENHRVKKLRKRLQKIVDDYEDYYPKRRRHKKRKKYYRHFDYY